MLLSKGKTSLDMRSAYGDSLVEAGLKYPEIVCVGADTTDSLKTKNFGNKFPERFFNVGIAEANLVSVAAWTCNGRESRFCKHICRVSSWKMPRPNS